MVVPEASGSPVVSVIIATFNWSSALRLAIRSVLNQTFQEFEVIVVGDGCTDDSEAVVRNFEDPRLQWKNLDKNYGSASAPNNHGISHARGRYIAYLGHDDIWWPTHLETMVQKAEAEHADVVAAMTIMSGAPSTGVYAATGLFPGNDFSPRYFFSPSSTLHTREVVGAIGGWRMPEEAEIAIDVDLFLRFYRYGAVFASTNDLTVFKFNAAWRRGIYKTRETSEQERTLAAAEARNEAFRQEQLIKVIHSFIEGRFQQIELPIDTKINALAEHQRNSYFKGTLRQNSAVQVSVNDYGISFYVEENSTFFEWHSAEIFMGSRRRWTGPSTSSSFRLPVQVDRPLKIEIQVTGMLELDDLFQAKLFAEETEIPSSRSLMDDGTWKWSAILHPEKLSPKIDAITIECRKLRRPYDLGLNEDRRWVGLQIGLIEIKPL